MALHCIVTGTSDYESRELDLPSVREDLRAIGDALESLGYRPAPVPPRLNPSREDLLSLDRWFGERQHDDDVVVYYVGHGIDDGQHYLLLSNGSQVASLDIIRTFGRSPQAGRILLVLDTCHSGAAQTDLGGASKELESRFQKAASNLTVVTSCRPREEAECGVFTPALSRALRNAQGRSGGKNQSRLFLPDLLQQLEPAPPPSQTHRVAMFPPTRYGTPEWDFPNPYFDRAVPERLDLESQRRLIERQTHWDDRIRYFVGRARALEDIDAYLRGDQPGALVVTGDPGSGKSSVLAHVVLNRTDIDVPVVARKQDLEQLIEIIAREANVALASTAVATVDERALVLTAALRERRRRLALVIDALDEAAQPSRIARVLLAELAAVPGVRLIVGVRPDSRRPGEPRFQALGSGTKEIDLDAPAYFDQADLATYVSARLSEAGPYRGDEARVSAAAEAVASKAGRCFLVARLICDGLAKGETPLTPAQIRQSVSVDVRNAFGDYLARFDDQLRPKIERALTPLAYAFGQGLPRVEWERLAPAEDVSLAMKEAASYITESVENKRSVYRLFHETFSDFFRSRDGADGHERFLEVLTPNDWNAASPYVRRYLALHAAAVSRLDELFLSPLFFIAADPAILRRVSASATSPEAAGRAAVFGLCAHLLRGDASERASTLVMAAHKFRYGALVKELDPLSTRALWWPRAMQWKPLTPHFVLPTSHGAVRAVALGRHDHVPLLATGGDDGCVQVWRLDTLEPYRDPRRIEAERDRITALAFRGSSIVGIRQLDALQVQEFRALGKARAFRWDLDTDLVSAPPLAADLRALNADDGACWAVAHADKHYEVWDVSSGHIVGRADMPDDATPGFTVLSPAVAAGHGKDGLFVARGKGAELDVRTCAGRLNANASAWSPADGYFNALSTGTYGRRRAIVGGTNKGALKVWDADTLEPLVDTIGNDENYVDAVAVGERLGASVVVSGGRDGTVRITVGHDRLPSAALSAAHTDDVTSLVPCDACLVSAGRDKTIRFWNAQTLAPLARLEDVPADRLALATDRGVVSLFAADDQTMACWNLELGRIARDGRIDATRVATETIAADESRGRYSALAVVDENDRTLVIAGDDRSRVRAMSGATLREVTTPLQTHSNSRSLGIQSLVVFRLGQETLLASAGYGQVIELWNTRTWKTFGRPMVGHSSVIYSVAAGFWRGTPVLASGSFDQTVRLWDPLAGTQLGEPLRGHKHHVMAVAFAEWNGETVLLSGGRDGFLRVWDLEARRLRAAIPLDSKIWSIVAAHNLVYAGCANGIAAIELR